MAFVLTENHYGKSDVRVTRVIRSKTRHDLIEMSVDVALRGDFDAAYLDGDNTKVVATDSMKNTVYVFAKRHKLDCVENYACDLAGHFVKTYGQIGQASVLVRQSRWKRITVKGKPHPHAFISGGNELRRCLAECGRDEGLSLQGGLDDLLVLKTTDSAFKDFVSDQYRTLKDTDDRIFATSVSATWEYLKPKGDFDSYNATIRDAMLSTFAMHKSLGVQQTLYAMGQAALKACPQIDSIFIRMPNKHRLPVNLQPFGLTNKNEVFVPTDEPFGDISGLIRRT